MAQPFVSVDIAVTFEANFADTTQTRLPTGIGASDNWSLGAGASKVAAVGTDDGDTGYVLESDVNSIQLFTFSAFSSLGSISTLMLTISAKEQTGDCRIQGVIRVGGTNYFATAVNLTGSYATYVFPWTLNPATLAPWLAADLEGTGSDPLEQIGFRNLSTTSGEEVRVSYLQASVTTGSWTDISEDVCVSPSPTWDWGFPGSSPTDLVASPGRLRISLKNDSDNSASLEGYYSPGHTNARTGWDLGVPMRVKVVASGSTSYKKYYVRSIRPDAGPAGPRRVAVLGTDWMDEAARQVHRDAIVQVDQLSGQIFTAITDSVARPPDNQSAAAGSYAYPFALEKVDTHRDTALKSYQSLAQSGFDRVYVKRDTTDGETLVFEDHTTRLSAPSNDATFNGDSHDLRAIYAEDRVINVVNCTSPVRERDTSNGFVLASIGADRPVIGAGETLILFLPYRDPDNEAESVSGTDIVDPLVATTDYTMESGITDTTSDHTVTITPSSTDCKFEIENTGTSNSTVTHLQVRGRGLYSYGEKHLQSEDAGSVSSYGERNLTFRVPWQVDVNVCQGMADWIISDRSNPRADILTFAYVANRHDTLAQASHDVDVGSRIAVTESVTGIASAGGTGYWVNRVMMRLDQTRLTVSYDLEFALEDQGWFELDSSTLDGADVLAYF